VDTRKNQDACMIDVPMSNDPNDMTAMSEETSSPLLPLSQDIIEIEMYHRWPKKVLGLFARTSQQAESETAFWRLLSSTVDAEPESYTSGDETKLAAIAILKRHPELLFRTSKSKVTAEDHYDRKIKGSPYQLLLGVGDTWALKQVHEEIIPNILGGEAEAKAQFKKQFPNCPEPFDPNMNEEVLYDDRNTTQIAEVKAKLKIVVEKINADPCTNGQATLGETTKAVADLCQIFAPKEGEIIKTGLHFPLGMMNEIGKVYDLQFTPWNPGQLAFFSRAVIGQAAAALSAVDGQCCKNGLGNLNMAQGPDRQDGLFCRRPKGIPTELAPLVGKLGRTMFVDPYDGYSCFLTSNLGYFDWYNKKGFGALGLGFGLDAAPLENLWKTKAETIGSYYAATRREVNTSSRWS
jgi:hypothetical protein